MLIKFLLSLLVINIIFLSFTKSSFAHIGDGPPFVKVNDKYALTNPLQANLPENGLLNIPQDIIDNNFEVNKPINFTVDLSRMTQFGLLLEAAKKTEYQWKFYSGSNYDQMEKEMLLGDSISKTFTKPGTYLVTLEIKSPLESRLMLVDTIAVNIVPNLTYITQFNTITIESELKSGKPSKFSVSSNRNVKNIYFDIDSKISNIESIDYTFKQKFYYDTIVVRTVSNEGIITDTGVVVSIENGNINFSLANQNETSDNLKVITKKSFSQIIIFIIGVNLILIIVGIILYKIKRGNLN